MSTTMRIPVLSAIYVSIILYLGYLFTATTFLFASPEPEGAPYPQEALKQPEVVAEPAQADTKMMLSWSHPTKRIDGTPLHPDEIQYTTLQWECNGKTGMMKIAAPTNTAVVGKPVEGLTCIYTLSTTDQKDITSDWSEALVVTGPFRPEVVNVAPALPAWAPATIQYLDDHFALVIQ